MDTQKPLICHECYGKLTNDSGPCVHALEVFDSGRTSALNEVDKLSNQLSICRDELSALKKRIADSPVAEISRGGTYEENFFFLERINGVWLTTEEKIGRTALPNLSDLEPGGSAKCALVRLEGT